MLLLLWLVGGIAALCGALTYAELASRLPRSGGEYNFLSQLYHPALGFVTGWVSFTVGFAAPTALAAMTFAAYLDSSVSHLVSINRIAAALLLVAILTVVHGRNRNASGGLQNWFTMLKVLLIVVFVTTVFLFSTEPQTVNLLPSAGDGVVIGSSAFAVALIYVNYAYTGWNSATYITGEIANPDRNLPIVLIAGTSVVIVLYMALNAIFLYAAPQELLVGKLEIGVIVAQQTFGTTGALVMGGVLSLLLISTVSAMLIAGPRVLQVMGEDFRLFRLLAVKNEGGVPRTAIYTQGTLSMLFIVTSSFVLRLHSRPQFADDGARGVCSAASSGRWKEGWRHWLSHLGLSAAASDLQCDHDLDAEFHYGQSPARSRRRCRHHRLGIRVLFSD